MKWSEGERTVTGTDELLDQWTTGPVYQLALDGKHWKCRNVSVRKADLC